MPPRLSQPIPNNQTITIIEIIGDLVVDEPIYLIFTNLSRLQIITWCDFQSWHIWAVCVTCQNWEVGLSPLDGSLQDKSEVPKDQMELQHNLLRKQCGPSWGLVHILQPVQQKDHSWLSCKNCGAYSGQAKRFCWHGCSWSDTRKDIITQQWWPCHGLPTTSSNGHVSSCHRL